MGRYLKNRRIRPSSKIHDPPPNYGASKLLVTLKLHYGGKFVYNPSLRYADGSLCVVDYVGPLHVSIEGILKLCEDVGLIIVKGLYILREGVGFNLVENDDEIKTEFLSRMSSNYERVMDVYVNCVDKIDTFDEVYDSDSESENEKDDEGDANADEDDDDIDNVLEHFPESDEDLKSDTEKGKAVSKKAVDDMLQACLEDHIVGDENNTGAGDGVDETGPVSNNGVESSDYDTESDSGDENVVNSCDELISVRGTDSEGEAVRFPVFREADIWDPKFQLGMKFRSKSLFKEAINSHTTKTMRHIKLIKNDKRRFYAKCMGIKCKWRINEGAFRICY